MLPSRSVLLGIPLLILAASCGPPPEPTPPVASTASPSATPAVTAAATAEPEAAPAATNAKTLSMNGATGCAVVSGKVACWGDNSKLVVAAGVKGPQPKPVLVSGIDQASMVVVGKQFGCALTSAGKVACFREGKAREISLLDGITDVALQGNVLLAVKKTGALVGIDLGYEMRDSSPAELPEIKSVSAITAGFSHACALHKNGEVTCWGDPEYNGGGVDTSEMDYEAREKLAKEAVKPKGLTDIVQISASDNHTCAIRKTKKVACWGSNWSGELGDGSQERRLTPVDVQLLDDATLVASGYQHTCAVRASGKVVCWGASSSGQLGSGNPGARGMVEVQGLTSAVALGLGEEVSCAAAQAGVSCWGSASRGRLGNGAISDYPTPQPVKGVTGAKLVGAGDRLSCAVDDKKQLSCWGLPGFSSDNEGKRGTTPKPIPIVGEVEVLNMRDGSMCTVDKAKNAFCDSAYSFLKEPRALKIGAVKWASGGGSSGTALLPSGQVVIWQRDWEKQDAINKQNVSGLADAVAAAGDSGTVCAVRKSGKVACVGYGFRVFDKKEPLKPAAAVEVPDVSDATSIVYGGGDMCFLRKSGEIGCFSTYYVPQPVDPKKPKKDVIPKKPGETKKTIEVKTVKGVTDAVALSANSGIRCALHKDGTVSCWGSNSYGQIGAGDYEYHWEPTKVVGLTDVIQVAAGTSQACALKKSGEVACWGRNQYDELGQSAPPAAYAPVSVLLPTQQ